MKSIKALLIDDEERNWAAIKNRFQHPFQDRGWGVDWRFFKSIDEARGIFAHPGTEFDLVVIDLLHERDDGVAAQEPYGLDLIAEARARYPRAFVLALSTGDVNWPDIFQDAGRRGAHLVVRRAEITIASHYYSPEAIAGQILDHLSAVGALHPMTLTYDVYDPDIVSLVYEVGEATLPGLYSRVLEASSRGAQTMNVSFLAPGASGAAVCAVESVVESTDSKIRHVLKLSRDKAPLVLEAERAAQAAAMIRSSLLVRTEPSEPVGPVNGWWAIASQLQRRADTFRTWLRTASPADVRDVLVALFTDGLSELYADTHRQSGSPVDLLTLPPFRQHRIKRAMEELDPALTHSSACGMDTAEATQVIRMLRTFVFDGVLVDAERRQISQPTYKCYAHGDLNTGNVLIYRGRDDRRPAPILIDMSGFELTHWAVDPARLAVDLLLGSVDSGIDSMLFAGFPVWRRLAGQLGDLQPMGAARNDDPGTVAALTALSWLTENLRSVCEVISTDEAFGRHGWEWRAALAMYFLRSTYNPAIPAQKRALALVAAYDQLRGAAAALPR